MGRRAGFHWDKREQAYRTDSGGKPKYFRGIARDDHAGIAAAFAAHLADLDARLRPPEPTVDQMFRAFVTAARGIKARTKRSHKERLLKFGDFPHKDAPDAFGGRKASSMTAADLRRALKAWKDEGLSDHYRAGVCRSVKAAFRWAASEEGGRLIPANAIGEVRGPAVERSPVRYAERREIAAFLRFAWRKASDAAGIYRRFGRLLVLMMRVAAHTGMRPGDLCSAWWQDFDPRARKITIPPDRHKTGSKTGKPLVVYLSRGLTRALARAKADPDRHPVAMFTHKRGRGAGSDSSMAAGVPWGRFVTLPGDRPSFESFSTPLAQAVRKLRNAAVEEGKRREDAAERTWGLELIRGKGAGRFVMYLLRHTSMSDNVMGGGDPATIAELHGTSVKMLDTTYGHLLDSHLENAAAELAARRRGKRPQP